jgi:hypothetical protein
MRASTWSVPRWRSRQSEKFRELAEDLALERRLPTTDEHEEEAMAKSGTKKVRDEKRPVRDLSMKPRAGAAVHGGKASPLLAVACATGKHYPTVTITS